MPKGIAKKVIYKGKPYKSIVKLCDELREIYGVRINTSSIVRKLNNTDVCLEVIVDELLQNALKRRVFYRGTWFRSVNEACEILFCSSWNSL